MKRIGSPKNNSIRVFFAKCRESSVRAFRKKTPIGVRRCREGAKGGTEKVRSFVTSFTDGLPKNHQIQKCFFFSILKNCNGIEIHLGFQYSYLIPSLLEVGAQRAPRFLVLVFYISGIHLFMSYFVQYLSSFQSCSNINI